MFEIIKEYPNMTGKVGDIITLPNEKYIYADLTYCKSDYFMAYPEYFKRLN